MTRRAPRTDVLKLLLIAEDAIGARHAGARAYADALQNMRAQITPETILDLINGPRTAAELIEDRIRSLAKHVEEAADLARAVARENGSDR